MFERSFLFEKPLAWPAAKVIMVPKPEDLSLDSSSNKADNMTTTTEPTCQELYGPYPSAIPIPFLSVRNEGREGDIPEPKVIQNAKAQCDMPADVRDKGTPDEWVSRDGRLVRLTGKHPFNVEPPLSVHQQYKFITPSSLHYVRNHGACPKLTWEDHTVLIGGECVSNKLELTMDQIAAYPPRELPVTLVCAGNRRKEQNMM